MQACFETSARKPDLHKDAGVAKHDEERLGPGDSHIESTGIAPEAQVEVAVPPRSYGGQRLGLGEHGGDEDDARLLALHVVHCAHPDAS